MSYAVCNLWNEAGPAILIAGYPCFLIIWTFIFVLKIKRSSVDPRKYPSFWLTVLTIKRDPWGAGKGDWLKYEDVALGPVDPADSVLLRKLRAQNFYGALIAFFGYILLIVAVSR